MTFRQRAIVVDGGAALAEDVEHGVVVVPQHITVGATEFIDDGSSESSDADFYRLLRAGGATATATPSAGAYLEAFRRTEAETVLCSTIPERWSGMTRPPACADMLAAEEGRAGSRSSTPARLSEGSRSSPDAQPRCPESAAVAPG